MKDKMGEEENANKEFKESKIKGERLGIVYVSNNGRLSRKKGI